MRGDIPSFSDDINLGKHPGWGYSPALQGIWDSVMSAFTRPLCARVALGGWRPGALLNPPRLQVGHWPQCTVEGWAGGSCCVLVAGCPPAGASRALPGMGLGAVRARVVVDAHLRGVLGKAPSLSFSHSFGRVGRWEEKGLVLLLRVVGLFV